MNDMPADEPEVVAADSPVTLREITSETVRDILRLKVKPEQDNLVAPNSVSLAEALFEEKAWYRAIYAGETPVGFVMLWDSEEEPKYYLWRYMIDARYQSMGFGRQALKKVIDYVRMRPRATELLLSYVPGEGSPEPFYAGLGFVNTGEVHDGENVMRLDLTALPTR
jgi:diamine N-acetyltransferase